VKTSFVLAIWAGDPIEMHPNMARALAFLMVVLLWPAIVRAEVPNFAGRYAGDNIVVELRFSSRGCERGMQDPTPQGAGERWSPRGNL
jgi:hypothetical protein